MRATPPSEPSRPRSPTTEYAAGSDDGDPGEADGWRGYPWWFETPDLFVLTGSMGYFFVLPKRGAPSPDDLAVARALFTKHLRRI